MLRPLILSLIALGCQQTRASAPPPIVTGSLSAHGRSLVQIVYRLGPPGKAGGQVILGTTYNVLSLIPHQQVEAPVTLLGTAWSLTLPPGPNRWPMVSDDGQTLLLLNVAPASSRQAFFDIYRHTGSTPTTLVRTVYAADLWSNTELNLGGHGITMIYDSTPFWFASGSLTFSPGCDTLLYRTQWNDRFRINLDTGAITRLH